MAPKSLKTASHRFSYEIHKSVTVCAQRLHHFFIMLLVKLGLDLVALDFVFKSVLLFCGLHYSRQDGHEVWIIRSSGRSKLSWLRGSPVSDAEAIVTP